MIKDELKERLGKKPFAPFRINTIDGSHYYVLKPFRAVAMETQMYLVLPNGRGKFLQLGQVSSVEDVTQTGTEESSGWF